MELKEQLKTIREVVRENIDYGKMVDAIMTAVAAYGNNCYNQALEDAANRAEICLHKDGERPYSVKIHEPNHRTSIYVDKQSILNLKKQ